MKNQLLLGVVALLLCALTACNQNAVDPNSSAASARSSSVSSGTITSGTATSGSSETIITQDKLPAAVGTYLTATYAGFTFVQAEQGTNREGTTYYEVQFTYNGVTKELHFNSAGVVQSEGSEHKGHGDDHDGPTSTTGTSGTATHGNSETTITQDKLPSAVGTYLTATYPGYTFVQAEQSTDSKGVTYYEVRFTYNGTTKELHFDANGAVLKK